VNLSDPAYNLREITKQMILLEEHLLVEDKYCPDCITKHLLTIEGLADEAQCLDKTGQWCGAAKQIGGWARRWASMYTAGTQPFEIGQEIRHVRKSLAPHVLDPEMIKAKRNPAQLLVYDGTEALVPSPMRQYLPLIAVVGLAATALYLYRDKGDQTGAYLDKMAQERW